jgi:hypothetical protein
VSPFPNNLAGALRQWRPLLLVALVFFAMISFGSGPAQPDENGAFLDALEQRGIQYFINTADPATGLVSDRAASEGNSASPVASAAATGFGLTALCVGVERGWVDRGRAADQVRRTLKALLYMAPTEHGYYFHWMDKTTCRRVWQSEVSSIDTALLIAGVPVRWRCGGIGVPDGIRPARLQ